MILKEQETKQETMSSDTRNKKQETKQETMSSDTRNNVRNKKKEKEAGDEMDINDELNELNNE